MLFMCWEKKWQSTSSLRYCRPPGGLWTGKNQNSLFIQLEVSLENTISIFLEFIYISEEKIQLPSRLRCCSEDLEAYRTLQIRNLNLLPVLSEPELGAWYVNIIQKCIGILLYKLNSNSSYKKFDCLPVQSGPGVLQDLNLEANVYIFFRYVNKIQKDTYDILFYKLTSNS